MRITRIFILFFSWLCAAGLSAQTGQIIGSVTDADGSGGLPGATIMLKSFPGTGAVTDFEGNYLLGNVPVGMQTLLISFVGFDPQERSVLVVAGEISELDVVLGSGVSLETVVVSGQALGQAKAINQQLNSDGVANFVSADKIKELPDVNAAEAISRLPGVAINRSGGEGSKIVVRGLDPKFTAININGVRLPSTSGTDRSVDLSLISPELLSGIELFKSPTPDMDGDALGGTVNLNILKADDRPRASIKMMGGYNDLVSEFKDYKVTGSMSRRVFNDKLGIIATANVERFNRSGDIISQGWVDNRTVLDTFNNIFDQEASRLSLTKNREIRRRYNGSLGLDYAFGKKTDMTLLGIYSRTSRDQFTHRENFSVLPSRGVSFSPGISESNISLYSASLSTRHRLNSMSIEWGVSYSQVVGQTPLNIDFDFRGVGNNFENTIPRDITNPGVIYDLVNGGPGRTALFGSSSIESGNQENISTAFIDLKLPFNVGDRIKAEFKFGGKFRSLNKSRDFTEFNDRLYYLRPIGVWDPLLPDGVVGVTAGADPATYLGASNFVGGNTLSLPDNTNRNLDLLINFDEGLLRRFDNLFRDQYPQDFFGVTNNYDLREDVFAGYAMFKFKMGEQLTVIPGLRYEANDNVYNGIFADLNGDWGESGERSERTATNTYGVLLPHLHLKYKPVEWFDVRASYSTTLARPDFNYIVPATLVNRNGDLSIDQGNPRLGPSVSTNYDLFLTAFSGKFGLISVGGFYKDIQDAFYPLSLEITSDSVAVANGLPGEGFIGGLFTSYDSSPDSRVYGIEFDIQSPLKFLPAPFNNLVFNLNYTRLYSNTTINNIRQEQECVLIRGRRVCNTNTFTTQREAALIGQASDIFNASLGYDIGGFSARVSASYQGTKLTSYSSIADKDRFDRDFWRMDAVVKYRFNRRSNVFLNVNNLTNQQDITFFRQESFETGRATFGTTATIGFEYKFIPKDSQ